MERSPEKVRGKREGMAVETVGRAGAEGAEAGLEKPAGETAGRGGAGRAPRRLRISSRKEVKAAA